MDETVNRFRLGVLVTCYREGPLLKRAWQSLDAQTDKDFQRVLVNDDPTHTPTVSACRELEKGGARVLWHDTNHGTSAARNSACRELDAEILIPLDADDTLPPNAVRIIRMEFQRKPQADFLFGDYRIEEPESRVSRRVQCAKLCDNEGFLDNKKLAGEFSIYGGSPFRRSLWEKISGYDPAVVSGAEDMDFWLRALTNGARGAYVPEVLYEWHRSKRGCNFQVTDRQWDVVYEKNRAFFEAAGPEYWQRLTFRRHLFLGNFEQAKKEAGVLARRGEFSKLVALFAFLPAGLAGPIYSAKKKMFGAARPF